MRLLAVYGPPPAGPTGEKHRFEGELGPSVWRRDDRDLERYLKDGDFKSAVMLVSLWNSTRRAQERNDELNWQHVAFIWPDRILDW